MKKIAIALFVNSLVACSSANNTASSVKEDGKSVGTKVAEADISCRADENGLDPVSLTVQIMEGEPLTKIDYKGNKISVGFLTGDKWEPQQMLMLDLNGFTSRIYSPEPSLYTLTAPNGVRIQCFFPN